MAWTKVFEEKLFYVYSFGGMFSDPEIDENLYNQLSEATSVKLSIEGRDPVVLPLLVPSPGPNTTFFGENGEMGPIFDTYDGCLYVALNSGHAIMNIVFNDEIEEVNLNTIVEIGEDDPTSLVKEYWDKNYPSINWNILPQLFNEEKIELTKEIEEYLKMTPWNTNHAILKTLSNSGGLTAKTIIVHGGNSDEMFESDSDIKTTAEAIDIAINQKRPDLLTVLYRINDETKELSYNESYSTEEQQYWERLESSWIYTFNISANGVFAESRPD